MTTADVAVISVAVLALAGLGWFFFGPQRARSARLGAGAAGRGEGPGRLQPGGHPAAPGGPGGAGVRPAGVWRLHFEPVIGLVLRPEIAALSMSGSSLLVALNALLLRRLRLPAGLSRTR